MQARAACLLRDNLLSVTEGPPGTGKTGTLASSALAWFVTTRTPILICTHSHTAAETVLRRLAQLAPQFGVTDDQLAYLRDYNTGPADLRRYHAFTRAGLDVPLARKPGQAKNPYLNAVLADIDAGHTAVVVCTAYWSDYLRTRRKGDEPAWLARFGLVLIDEASQASESQAVVALRWARDGATEELDLDGTIRATAEHGYLDVQTRPERRNAVKVLLFLDVGGSMDPYVKVVEELFSAARAEFKHMEYYYFHNCLYEGVWRDNRRRYDAQTPTWEVLNTYGPDYKCIFVGDASMSPYEVAYPGGASEHWNAEAGQVWLRRARDQWTDSLWINPVPENHWPYTQSIGMISEIFESRMVPMTLDGLERGMRLLTR